MARVTGEVELEDKVLVIRRIHVRMELKVASEQRETSGARARLLRELLPPLQDAEGGHRHHERARAPADLSPFT